MYSSLNRHYKYEILAIDDVVWQHYRLSLAMSL